MILAISSPLRAAVSSSFPARAAGADNHTTRTNWVENTVTNLIEIRMARNRFVNEYRTNWIEHAKTNFFDVYQTNHLTRHITNRFVVDAWRTNSLDVFHTNWQNLTLTNEIAIKRMRTNFVDSYHTNWKQLTLTNEVAVNLTHTNLVALYRTNTQTLSLTNWQTVPVMKTNWVTQFVTNVVQLDLPKSVSVPQPAPEKRAAAAPPHPAAIPDTRDDPIIEVSRTTKPPANGLVEVEIRIRWPAGTVDAPPVQKWRIERIGGSFICFGQEQEFRKELPVGNYTVEARLQRDADSPSFLLRGTLAVTIKETIVQQRTDRSKIAAVSDRP